MNREFKVRKDLRVILGLRVYKENLDRRVNRVHKGLRAKLVHKVFLKEYHCVKNFKGCVLLFIKILMEMVYLIVLKWQILFHHL